MITMRNEYDNYENEQDDNNSDYSQCSDNQNLDGAVIINSGGFRIFCLTIIGQIEGHYILPSQNKATKYEHIIPQIVAADEDDKIDGMLLLLNTVGGDVEAGLAIAELIAGMKKPTVSIVLGGGHSIGVPLAVSADHSFIVKSATMTIHPVRLNGLVLGVPQSFDYFRKMQNRITTFVTEHSHITKEMFQKLAMNTQELVTDVGSVLEGPEAAECGLIDSVGSLSEAIKTLCDMIRNKKV